MNDVEGRYTVHTKQECNNEEILKESELFIQEENLLSDMINQVQKLDNERKWRAYERKYQNWISKHPPVQLKDASNKDFQAVSKVRQRGYGEYLKHVNKRFWNVYLNMTSIEDYNPYEGQRMISEILQPNLKSKKFVDSNLRYDSLCRQDTSCDLWGKVHESTINSEVRLKRQDTIVNFKKRSGRDFSYR